MINSDDFSKRLQKIIEYYSLTASSFADAIDFNRSSISHLLSGRNKPSLEFVLKVLHKYPEVKLYWLINGIGNFPETTIENTEDHKKVKIEKEVAPSLFDVDKAMITDKFQKEIENGSTKQATENFPIEKIVIFYKNGSFKLYEN
ncbi:MAG: transcriptional regulator [Bacteroidetes bacterium HGW-Bacteroidetes-2]|jgi:transcriptional regulator with XRE-family HTH domain|nr:MAG: transcriptional regulator [Bacteroidetes bacterium HGW-Bacteroidetes-2]